MMNASIPFVQNAPEAGRVRFHDPSANAEMAKVQDVYLSARALSEAAIRYQAVPRFPECEGTRESLKRRYDQALRDLQDAING